MPKALRRSICTVVSVSNENIISICSLGMGFLIHRGFTKTLSAGMGKWNTLDHSMHEVRRFTFRQSLIWLNMIDIWPEKWCEDMWSTSHFWGEAFGRTDCCPLLSSSNPGERWVRETTRKGPEFRSKRLRDIKVFKDQHLVVFLRLDMFNACVWVSVS